MYTPIIIPRSFKNYTGKTKSLIREILEDAFSEILKRYSKDLFENGTTIVEENVREQILDYFKSSAINGVPFTDLFNIRSESPCPDAVGHIDIQFEEIDTKKKYGIELKCHAEFSSSGKGKRSAYDVTALGVHQDISRLEKLYAGSGFVVLITDEKSLYTESGKSKNPFLNNLRQGKINKGTHMNESRKKTGEVRTSEVWIKNSYSINWEGSEKTKGFILEI